MSDRLHTLSDLSREFGTPLYVHGGGGNTSAKDESTLWIKPSGLTLREMAPERFVALDRAKIAALYALSPPADAQEREAKVKDLLLAAVRAESGGRPSVETPLHDSFDAVYVVHTHPAAVNGLTCAIQGEAACRALFPEALWVPYTDPGYTLSIRVREAMASHVAARGRQPTVLLLQNHGVFVAGDTAGSIRDAYGEILSTLQTVYDEKGVSVALVEGPPPPAEEVETVRRVAREALGEEDGAAVVAGGCLHLAKGPLSPDHIVYSRSFPLMGQPTPEAFATYQERHGRAPRVLLTENGCYGLGGTEKSAALALTFARDGARVRQLADAFGGIRYLDDRARRFIETWEVESYRQRMARE